MKREVLDAIKNRRSLRKFKAEQIDLEKLGLILEAGTFAPTGNGAQSPVIVVVQDAGLVAQLGKMNAKVLGTDANPYYGAPTILLVFAAKNRRTYIEDGSCVLQNMMLAAYSVGLGSCWIHREREMFETPEGKELMKQWGLSEDYAGIGALAVGVAEGELPAAAPRKEGYIIRA
ncbi:MAG: nitroreductase family protein [Planctomycetaceae bacterium]|jgi:nitroreductase|nr:nitroreductase family protein [Planctomycetaceae bacterium]